MASLTDILSTLTREGPSYYIDKPEPLKPVAVLFDYRPAIKIRVGWCNERGTEGRGRSAVIHALAEREMAFGRAKIAEGQPLCGFKSSSRHGKSDYSIRPGDEVTCPKCKDRAVGLSESILPSRYYSY